MVEFTYEGDTQRSVDLTIDEVFCKPITLEQLEVITPILGQCFDDVKNENKKRICTDCGGNGYKNGIVKIPGTDCPTCKATGYI